VFGPTAVGKTEFALALARRLRGAGRDPVAVSADALQVYRGLEILTGVATSAEQNQLEHRLVSIADVSESFSAGRFAELAHAEIDGLLDAGRTPIVVGGTGLYLRAALADLSLAPPPPPELRARWQAELQRRGPAALHAELATKAPAVAARIAPADRSRIVRALELYDLDALPDDADDAEGTASELWTEHTRHPTLLLGLTRPREELYARIDARVDAMVAAGAAEAVRLADEAGAGDAARKALGFAELQQGDVEAMKQRTRRYAKRQLTWMRKLAGVRLVDLHGRSADEAVALLDMIEALDGSPLVAASQQTPPADGEGA
jgi:tRNA dimethylallyltransferase